MYSATNGVTMQRSAGQQDGTVAQLKERELTLAPLAGDGPDPRLVELARLLARRVARQWYDEMAEERRGPRP